MKRQDNRGNQMPKQRKLSNRTVRIKNRKSEEFQNCKKILINNSVMQDFETNKAGENCNLILSAIGITIEDTQQRSYSLKKISNDKEFVKNPKILERKDYKTLQNEYDKPDEKFPNEDDPFYQLDDHGEQNEIYLDKKNNFMNSNKTQALTRDIIKNNFKKRTLKQLEVLK